MWQGVLARRLEKHIAQRALPALEGLRQPFPHQLTTPGHFQAHGAKQTARLEVLALEQPDHMIEVVPKPLQRRPPVRHKQLRAKLMTSLGEGVDDLRAEGLLAWKPVIEGAFRNPRLLCDLRDADVLETCSMHRSQRRANEFRACVAGEPHPATLGI